MPFLQRDICKCLEIQAERKNKHERLENSPKERLRNLLLKLLPRFGKTRLHRNVRRWQQNRLRAKRGRNQILPRLQGTPTRSPRRKRGCQGIRETLQPTVRQENRNAIHRKNGRWQIGLRILNWVRRDQAIGAINLGRFFIIYPTNLQELKL